jgi:hypothetical protein
MKKALIPVIACGFLGLAAASGASQGRGVVVSHHETLASFELTPSQSAGQQKTAAGAAAMLSFDAFGRRFDIELESNDRLLSVAARNQVDAGTAVYRGRIVGQENSWARIVVADGMPRGVIWDGSEMIAIEAPGDSAVSTTEPIAYRLADTYVIPGTMTCGSNHSLSARSGSAAAMYGKLLGELETAAMQGPGASSQLDIGAIGDFELFERFGSDEGDTEAAILTRLNTVDGIYSEQLGVQIFVDELAVFTTDGDPFTDTTVSGDLLDELGIYRRDTNTQRAQGLTHLYTGRDLAGSTVGIAYLDALCSPRFGSGLSEGRGGATIAALIAAHEIGHNFGAVHDGEEGEVCESTPETFLMAPSVNQSDKFSQCSIDTMTPNIAAASCIAPLPTVDMRMTTDGSAPPVLLGGTVNLSFTATNAGTQQATGVSIEVEVPDNFSLQSANTSFGTCTSGAGIVDCTYGTVIGNDSRTVTLTVEAADVGDGTFTANVTAETDVNASNDQRSMTVTVNPAVDLAVNAIAAAQVNLDQQLSVSIDLENRSVIDASDVEISISLNNGLRADTASWTLGTCTVADRQVDCEATAFAGQSDATLNLALTGTATGSSNYTVSLTSSDDDAVTSNNSVTASVQVGTMNNTGGGDSSSGGGGAAGYLLLILLGARAYGARRRIFPRY